MVGKVVWKEGDEIHSARVNVIEEEAGFLKFGLPDGRILLLAKAAVIKIEENAH